MSILGNGGLANASLAGLHRNAKKIPGLHLREARNKEVAFSPSSEVAFSRSSGVAFSLSSEVGQPTSKGRIQASSCCLGMQGGA